MRGITAFRAVLAGLLLFSITACSKQVVKTLSLENQAALEATAMIDQARATAMILEARAQATALLRQEQTPAPTVVSAPVQTTAPAVPITPAAVETTGQGSLPPAEEDASADEYKIELIDVTYGGDGGFVVVNFYATYKAASDLWQGTISVTDEQSGTIYNEVATMPIIGPLIGRPKEWGQPGYVMLVNTSPGLPATTLVTVVLGQFKHEHVSIRP